MDDVASNINAKITSDGSWLRVEWLCGTEHLSSGLDSVVSFPDHAADWPRGGVFDESSEESFLREVCVMFFELCLTC